MKEATPSAISRAIVCTCGAAISRPLGGRFRAAEPGGAEADADADEDDPAEVEDAERAEQLQRRGQQGDAIVASASRARAPENSGTIQRRSQ